MNTLTHMSDIMIPMVIFWIVGYGMVSGRCAYRHFWLRYDNVSACDGN